MHRSTGRATRCPRLSTGTAGWASARRRPFINGAYHPGEWRRRVGFGTGTLGDMGCHIYSPPYRALKLSSPVAVTSYGPPPTDESWATKARVKLTYPGTEFTAGQTVDVWWYDGGELPPDGDRGDASARGCRRRAASSSAPMGCWCCRTSDRGRSRFQADATSCCRRSRSPSAITIASSSTWSFRAAGRHVARPASTTPGPLTESVLIGNVAARFPGETLEFDGTALSFPRRREANEYLTRSYRRGWYVGTSGRVSVISKRTPATFFWG